MIVQTRTRPATSLRLLCDAAAGHGISTTECLQDTGLTANDLNDPGALHTTDQEIQAILNYVRLAPHNVGLGWAVAQNTHVHAFGIWGFAILTSPTLSSAIQTATEYSKLSYVIADLSLRRNGKTAKLEFYLGGLPEPTHRYISERQACVAVTFIRALTQQPDRSDFVVHMQDKDAGYAEQMT